MTWASSVVIGAFILAFLLYGLVNLVDVINDSTKLMLETSKDVNSVEKQEIDVRVVSSDSSLIVELMVYGNPLRVDELSLVDVMLFCYSSSSGNSLSFWLAYQTDWRLLNVTLAGGPELLNPVNVTSSSGLIDEGETATIEVDIPSECDVSKTMLVLFVTPEGAKGTGVKG